MHAGLFFFSSRRRHTRYWRDWSSDVCSSDLRSATRSTQGVGLEDRIVLLQLIIGDARAVRVPLDALVLDELREHVRSEERRVGKECRSRRSPYQSKKKKVKQL